MSRPYDGSRIFRINLTRDKDALKIMDLLDFHGSKSFGCHVGITRFEDGVEFNNKMFKVSNVVEYRGKRNVEKEIESRNFEPLVMKLTRTAKNTPEIGLEMSFYALFDRTEPFGELNYELLRGKGYQSNYHGYSLIVRNSNHLLEINKIYLYPLVAYLEVRQIKYEYSMDMTLDKKWAA